VADLAVVYRPIGELIPTRATADPFQRAGRADRSEHPRIRLDQPDLVDDENGIIAGHGRLLAACRLGIDPVPCIGLSEAQRRAYILADDKLALNAGWDEALLRVELADLRGMAFDLALIGFGEAQQAALLNKTEGQTDPDDAPEAPKHPVSQPSDCMGALPRRGRLCVVRRNQGGDRGGRPRSLGLRCADADRLGLEQFRHRPRSLPRRARALLVRREKRARPAHWSGHRSQTTLWLIDKPLKPGTGHSTQKPVESMRRPIENHSQPGDAVYEPFFWLGQDDHRGRDNRTALPRDRDQRGLCRCSRDAVAGAFTRAQATLDGDGRTFDEVAAARAQPGDE
jgi:hypothetical protein